jgi:SAM-dependent methyltransferase
MEALSGVRDEMRGRARDVVARGLRRLPRRARGPLTRRLQRSYYAYLALRSSRDTTTHRGLPVPPPRLRVLVSHRRSNARTFLDVGERRARGIAESVERSGLPMREMRAFLDFGCGCGRVARWWADLSGPSVYGCDYNPELVRWCAENLTFMEATVNDLSPPLPFEAEQFDFVYALSVFIHMPEELEALWMAELRRVLRPGGLLLLTLRGPEQLSKLDAAEREAFDRTGRVTRFRELAGTNMCGAFHSRRYVETEMLRGFELAQSQPGEGSRLGRNGYLARRL